jgi:hypothetical protein
MSVRNVSELLYDDTSRRYYSSLDSSVGMTMGYVMNDGGSIPGRERDFYLYSVQTGSGAHPISYPSGTGGSFTGA